MCVGFLTGLFNHLDTRPSAAVGIRRVTSDARLSRTYGRYSGFMLNLLRILLDNESRWYHAWLTLEDVGEGWFELREVQWR